MGAINAASDSAQILLSIPHLKLATIKVIPLPEYENFNHLTLRITLNTASML